MKKLLIAAFAAGLLAPALTATKAVAADPAPTNVKISWKDNSYQYIHVSWNEDGSTPNKVFVRHVGQPTQYAVQYVAADAPNELDLRTAGVGPRTGPLEIAVVAGTAEGETSPAAASKAFDTDLPGAPVIVSTTATGADSLTVKWRAATPAEDSTPNDPLDGQPVRFQPRYAANDVVTPIGSLTTATELVFKGPASGYTFSVASQNEWYGGQVSTGVSVRSSGLTAKIPTWALFGDPTVIKGSITNHNDLRQIVLQARNTASSTWYVVSTSYFSGSFEFRVSSPGTRQYRVLSPNLSSLSSVYFGGATAPVTTTTAHNPYTARFYTPVVKRGQTAVAELAVRPAFSGKVSLQRWNGKTWTGVKDVAINQGYAKGTFPANLLGRVAYRYYVPGRTWNGLVVAAAYSPTFVLTTIR